MRLRDLPDTIEPRELLYPSNLLTVIRLLLVAPTLATLRRPERRRAALLYIAAAMLTDGPWPASSSLTARFTRPRLASAASASSVSASRSGRAAPGWAAPGRVAEEI